ncbi:MAG: dienelactone hydrolase family protein [Chloroflexi bacterium]|nr:dienelactone hydrolase family protein [Chloroflexota bacterium]
MNYFQRYLVEEFAEDYQEGRISRRKALKLIASVTGSAVIANSILAACAPPPESTEPGAGAVVPGDEMAATGAAEVPVTGATGTPESAQPAAASTGMPDAQGTPGAHGTVMPDDPSIEASDVEFAGEDGATLLGYLARPAGGDSYAVTLVCHENRGLTEHIKDVTRRLAKAGYAALAVDLLSRSGGTSALSEEEIPGILGNTPPEQFVQDFRSGWRYMQEQPFAEAERVGMVGFCFGGGVTWRMAVEMPELRAAVPFYGPHPPIEEVPRIEAPVMAIYGELDQRINQGIPAIEEAMQQNNKVFEYHIYPNADHAFFNDTGQRYNPEAARDAWARTLAWFGQYLA